MFSSVQSLNRVWLFATPWIAARQASLSITNSGSSLKLTCIKSVMPSSHLILCHPLLLLPPIRPSIRVFSNESTFRMRWPKYWSFSFSIIPSKEIPGLISFRIYIIVKIFRHNWKITASFPSPEFAWHGIIKCHLASGVSLVINREFLSVSHTPLPPRSPVYIFKDLAWR